MENRLTLFLYLIMRDYLPVGKIPTIINEMEDMIADKKTYTTNENLENLAKEFAERIRI